MLVKADDGVGVDREIKLVEEETISLQGLRQVRQGQVADVAFHPAVTLPDRLLPKGSPHATAISQVQVGSFIWNTSTYIIYF